MVWFVFFEKGANTGTDSNGSEVVLVPDGEGNF